MKELINILDFLPEELEEKIKPMFRVKQIYQWIYQKYANNFSDMSSLPKD
ncbi:TPA: 23S rRNA (adenine(2503)-C(2))-methyltransferase RlmN, partial [Campylobacter coli]|nr:23S rRNA (adenine(2503)-C(2))-methyltransferase RlmN [Campylobacter coli]